MKFIATFLSGLFLFSPSFLFAYYLAYVHGIVEIFDHTPSEIGVNYPEYIFQGYLEFSVDFLGKFLTTIKFITLIIAYIVALFACLIFGTHPSARKKLNSKIEFIHYRFVKFFKKNKIEWLKNINSIPSAIFILFLVFLLSLIPILKKYQQGESEATDSLNKILQPISCFAQDGYIKSNNEIQRTKKILCGSTKCLVVDLDHAEIKIILPEQYIAPLLAKKMKRISN